MKKLLLTLLTLALTHAAGADTTLLTEADGWHKTSTLAPDDLDSHYYVFVDPAADLMLALDDSPAQGYPAAFYKESADPVADLTRVWKIETNDDGYALRPLTASAYQMMSGWNGDGGHTHWYIKDQYYSCNWTRLRLTYAADAWTITSAEYNRPIGIYGNGTDTPTPGTELGANDEGYAQTFLIYAITKADFQRQYLAGATTDTPRDATRLLLNSDFGPRQNNHLPFWGYTTGFDNNGIIQIGYKTFTFCQTLTDLPAGTYRVSTYMNAYNTTTAHLYAEGDTRVTADPTSHVESTDNDAWLARFNACPTDCRIEVETTVTDGRLTLGVEDTEANAQVVQFAPLTLTYLGHTPSDTPTHINAALPESAARKAYDLQGRRVKTAHKGMYIVNGKKILVP